MTETGAVDQFGILSSTAMTLSWQSSIKSHAWRLSWDLDQVSKQKPNSFMCSTSCDSHYGKYCFNDASCPEHFELMKRRRTKSHSRSRSYSKSYQYNPMRYSNSSSKVITDQSRVVINTESLSLISQNELNSQIVKENQIENNNQIPE